MALECLDIYEEMDLPTHIGRLGNHLADGLKRLGNLPGVFDVRSQGLIGCVEFETAEQARAIGQEAEARGVFFRIIGPVLAIAPPYITTEADLDEILSVMAASIQAQIALA